MMDSGWRRVVGIVPGQRGQLELSLVCGHTTRISPHLPLGVIRQGLMASTVPCALCGRPETMPMPRGLEKRVERGLREAADETRHQVKRERMWMEGEEVVRGKGEYL